MLIPTLTLSDILIQFIYSPQIRNRFADIELVLGCGDLPYYYLEYIISVLNVPLYFVRGNHANVIEYTVGGPRKGPLGGVNLHRKVVNHNGLLLAGVEGSLRYREGPFQYTQGEMWANVLRLVPALLVNRAVHGRYLDVFVSHAPPWGIHDREDLAHQGIKAFRWLLEVFQPRYHFHGHIHVYQPGAVLETQYHHTQVINTYGYREVNLEGVQHGFAPLGFLSKNAKTIGKRPGALNEDPG
jgi:hypothetical protein